MYDLRMPWRVGPILYSFVITRQTSYDDFNSRMIGGEKPIQENLYSAT
jgi:hypothetical protein